MSNGIRSLPRYQHGGPHPRPHPNEYIESMLKHFEDAQAASPSNATPEFLAELAASDEHLFQGLERRGIPAPEFPSAPRTTSISDEIRGVLSPNESAFRALERKAAFEKLLKDFVPLSPGAKDLLSPEDLDLYYRRLESLGGFPNRRNPQELPWELLSPEDRELTPYRSPGKRFSQSHWTVRPSPPDVDPPIRRGISRLSHRAGRAVRNVGIAGLKAIRNRLPSVIGAGLATAAASHPASAAVDIALSPTPMGSGDMPKRDPRSNEDRMKYYDDLMNLQRELGVGQHGPSISQLSREISRPSIRSSYPMGR